jgi:two-component system chemotaxis response regulator CheB
MPRIRVLIVDDAVVIRRMLTSVIEKDDALEVAGVAANGKIALQKIPQCNPDLVTLDVEMPEMNGIETVKEIRRQWPNLPVIMVSTLTARGAMTTIEALNAGATDYVTKPANVGKIVEGLELIEQQLVPKIHALCGGPGRTAETAAKPAAAQALRKPSPITRRGAYECFAIGTSTGGPNALHTVFSGIQTAPRVPLFIVQHMPPLFTAMLAERLDKCGPIRFHEATHGMVALPGHAYLAPGGKHMVVRRENGRPVIQINEEPPENSCRPAVDPLFRSLASAYGPSLLALVMTGMGQDGLRGCEHVHEQGGTVMTQDEKTSVVWGMPGYVTNAGLSAAVLPLADIAREIESRLADRRQAA